MHTRCSNHTTFPQQRRAALVLVTMTGPQMPAVLTMVAIVVPMVRSVCNVDSGPAGSLDCFSHKDFYEGKHQWGTCLTNEYIQRKSRGHQRCQGENNRYCYYQCMLEMHGKENGPVTPDCACDPQKDPFAKRPPTNVSILPSTCYSPDGSNCSWYRNCLEERYQCSSGGQDDYHIRYSETFCRVFEKNRSRLSPAAQTWMDNARKCLLVKFVPLLRYIKRPTCDDLRKIVLNVNARCYVRPMFNGLSICDLDAEDFWKVFWTTRLILTDDFVERVLELFKQRQECVDHNPDKIIRKLRIDVRGSPDFGPDTGSEDVPTQRMEQARSAGSTFRLDSHQQLLQLHTDHWDHGRHTRQVGHQQGGDGDQNGTALYFHHKATGVTAELARQLRWQAAHVVWFSYGVYLGQGKFQVHILLGDEALGTGVVNGSSANLTAVVERTERAFQRGEVRVMEAGRPVYPLQLSVCEDLRCNNISRTFTTDSSTTSMASPLLVISAVVAVVVNGLYQGR